jgi:hypothetical protein
MQVAEVILRPAITVAAAVAVQALLVIMGQRTAEAWVVLVLDLLFLEFLLRMQGAVVVLPIALAVVYLVGLVAAVKVLLIRLAVRVVQVL